MNIISRNSLSALGAPLVYHKWALTFLDLPSIGLTDEQLCLRCISCDKPSIEIEKTTIEQAGFTIHYAGKTNFDGSISFSFLSTGEGNTVNTLQDWKELCCSTMAGGSVTPSDYKSSVLMADLGYDNETVIKTYLVHGMWPSAISFSDGYGASVEAQQCNVTFSYDWWE